MLTAPFVAVMVVAIAASPTARAELVGQSGGAYLAGAGAVMLIGGIAAWSLRAFGRNQDAHNDAAARHDAALTELARVLGWTFVPGSAYSHSMIGTYAGWGTTVGRRDDLDMQVGMNWSNDGEGPVAMSTVVTVKAPTGQMFAVPGGKVLKLARKRGALDRRNVAPFPVAELEALAIEVEVKPNLFVATLAPPARFWRSLSYVLGVQTDVAVLASAVAACTRAARAALRPHP
jgi:hypothetical protein